MDLQIPKKELPLEKPENQDHSQIPGRGLYSEEARVKRLEFLQAKKNCQLSTLATSPLEAESLKGNIENYLGALTIPIGVAGPLLMNFASGKSEEVFAPIATTEGALVASITRGARALSLSGGVRVKVIQQKMTRVPMFEFADLFQATEFADWIHDLFPEIQKNIKRYSNYSELLEIKPHHVGRSVHLRFVYTTRDAAGQNMTTICTWNTCKWILEKVKETRRFQLKNFILEGNVSSDKKASFGSMIHGRGTEVVAEAVIKSSVLKDVLKADIEQLVHLINLSKSARIHSGMMGWNINVANVVAGMFSVTGQDIACVHECSVAETHVESQVEPNGEKSLYLSVHIPCLIVGTIGGGTRLPVQNEMLELLGCRGEGKSERLAEIIAGFSLALEISTMCAIFSGQFADAHTRLGRSQVGKWLKPSELEPSFIVGLMPDLADAQIQVVAPIENAQFGNSLVMDMSSQVTQKLCGFFPFQIQYREKESAEVKAREILLKIKPKDEEVIIAAEMMASMCGENLKQAYQKIRPLNLFQKTHLKEIYVNQLSEIRASEISPILYGQMIDEQRQIFILAQEFIRDFSFEPGAEQVAEWTWPRIEVALKKIAHVHAEFLGKTSELMSKSWIGYIPNESSLKDMKDFFRELIQFGAKEFPSWLTAEMALAHQKMCDSVEVWSARMERRQKTLVHNDFNPRNLGFRKSSGKDGQEKFVAFDWELATIGLPQRDAVELLSFTLSPDSSRKEILHFLEIHRCELSRLTGVNQDLMDWLSGAQEAIREFIVHRLALYFVAHSLRECSFLPQTYRTAMRIAQVLDNELNS